MIPPPFAYERVDSVDAALALLAEHGDEAKLLAGGHSLIPLLKTRLAAPEVLIDVGRIEALSYVRHEGDHVAVGALTRHRDLETSPVLREHLPLVAHAASHVGDPQVRHRGTIGGSLAHADPASDLPAVVLALGGSLVARGSEGERTIAASDFYRGFLETVLEPTEMLVEIRLPIWAGAGWSFQKFTRRAQDWAIVGVAAVRDGQRAGVGLVNMGLTPLLAVGVGEALAQGADAATAAAHAAEGTEPPEDNNGSAEYRRHLAEVLVRRALVDAGA